MKLLKLQFALITLLVVTAAAAAQQPPATQAKPAAPPLLPKGKVAVINTAIFQEQVEEFKAKVDQLNRQFEPRVKDVQSLADKINALETTIKSQSGVLTPARVAEMTENLEGMK